MKKIKEYIIDNFWLIHLLIGTVILLSAMLFGEFCTGQIPLGCVFILSGAWYNLLIQKH
jgi:hypothetical protein